MKAVDVQLLLDDQGKAIPQKIIWQGQTFLVDSIGRRWVDENGEHILVQLRDQRVFHLLLSPQGNWFQIPIRGGRERI
ncbi:MAG: hypothetical protein AB1345_08845 [Chloroflexota bacterium]